MTSFTGTYPDDTCYEFIVEHDLRANSVSVEFYNLVEGGAVNLLYDVVDARTIKVSRDMFYPEANDERNYWGPPFDPASIQVVVNKET